VFGNGNSRFTFFSWESRGNGNGQRVIWVVKEWEWELLRGNGREREWANVAKFPYRTAQTQMSRLHCKFSAVSAQGYEVTNLTVLLSPDSSCELNCPDQHSQRTQ